MELLWSRESMIGLAVIGGLLSLAVMVLRNTGRAAPALLERLNRAAYGFMLASVTVFIVAGFRGGA
jgi:presenilin-like A22 family membrane protease